MPEMQDRGGTCPQSQSFSLDHCSNCDIGRAGGLASFYHEETEVWRYKEAWARPEASLQGPNSVQPTLFTSLSLEIHTWRIRVESLGHVYDLG